MEAEFLEWLRPRLATHPQVRVGLGSDAAILDLPSRQCVVTTDAITDGVDFILAQTTPQRVGRKALAVNLSDLAAMAARPVAAFVTLVLPRAGAAELARGLYDGILPLAEQFSIGIAGGDTNTWDGPLVVSITAIGEPTSTGTWTRAGAQPGDVLFVTGPLGGSLLGKHFDFVPRVREALLLNEQFCIHAATDISDGLSLDLSHITGESNCGAVLDLDKIPIAQAAAEMCRRHPDGRTPLDRALSDGEDFELLLAVPPDDAERLTMSPPAGVSVTAIGQFVREPGLRGRHADGTSQPIAPRGYQH